MFQVRVPTTSGAGLGAARFAGAALVPVAAILGGLIAGGDQPTHRAESSARVGMASGLILRAAPARYRLITPRRTRCPPDRAFVRRTRVPNMWFVRVPAEDIRTVALRPSRTTFAPEEVHRLEVLGRHDPACRRYLDHELDPEGNEFCVE